jgi:large subunit ribosomal protein L38
MVGNIHGSDLTSGDRLCDYLPPFPPFGTGYHRYAFVLYKQEARIDFSKEQRSQARHRLTRSVFIDTVY